MHIRRSNLNIFHLFHVECSIKFWPNIEGLLLSIDSNLLDVSYLIPSDPRHIPLICCIPCGNKIARDRTQNEGKFNLFVWFVGRCNTVTLVHTRAVSPVASSSTPTIAVKLASLDALVPQDRISRSPTSAIVFIETHSPSLLSLTARVVSLVCYFPARR